MINIITAIIISIAIIIVIVILTMLVLDSLFDFPLLNKLKVKYHELFISNK